MGMKSYWDAFYRSRRPRDPGDSNCFEWFFPYSETKDVFQSAFATVAESLPGNDFNLIRIAELGCGTSELSMELVQDHQSSCCITCVDFSMAALENNQNNVKSNDRFHRSVADHLAYVAADVCHLPFPENSFDLVFEKGTMDALLKSENTRQKSDQFLLEAIRVLRPGGMFLQFSDEAPELRLDLLERMKSHVWQREHKHISVSFKNISHNDALEYFVYTVQYGKI
ncbi:citrate synthase-lysine N-methyltransferase CSKMT, mitochondrial-like [Strongylocentrotus purpuratus]|uniref:Methyltransferase type 11 domain-containing protein n=1 Tax=Strongylocentrotus purpuratus TaxID=7668 RepID=A0A7M7PTA7_STRPU|nr:citrate synthase-lysine N-methyltransferase CSKMT, mitochondrial-like [Strongylocentrotus purpuratus]